MSYLMAVLIGGFNSCVVCVLLVDVYMLVNSKLVAPLNQVLASSSSSFFSSLNFGH